MLVEPMVWHITKLPLPAQLGSPCPPVRVQVPTTTPLESVPVVVVVPLEVPVRSPVNVKVLPDGVTELTVRVTVPVTAPAELVDIVAFPLWVVAFCPVAKHAPELKKLRAVIFKGPLLVTENEVTKFRRLACCVPPVRIASQSPVVDVLFVVDVFGLVPQAHSAIASDSRITNGSFSMHLP